MVRVGRRVENPRILTWRWYPLIRLRSPSGLWPDNLSLGTMGTISDSPPTVLGQYPMVE